MRVNVLFLIAIFFFNLSYANADDCKHFHTPKKPTIKQQWEMDKKINNDLNLSQEQQDLLKKNRAVYRKEMEKLVKQMEELHIKIRDVYYSGIPKIQADVKTAPMKAELVLLKQNADKLRQERRKYFESVLTPEQMQLFKEFKQKNILKNK